MIRLLLLAILLWGIEFYFDSNKAIYDLKMIGESLLIIIPAIFLFIIILNLFPGKSSKKKIRKK